MEINNVGKFGNYINGTSKDNTLLPTGNNSPHIHNREDIVALSSDTEIDTLPPPEELNIIENQDRIKLSQTSSKTTFGDNLIIRLKDSHVQIPLDLIEHNDLILGWKIRN